MFVFIVCVVGRLNKVFVLVLKSMIFCLEFMIIMVFLIDWIRWCNCLLFFFNVDFSVFLCSKFCIISNVVSMMISRYLIMFMIIGWDICC